MTDTVTLPRAVVERCLRAAQGCVNAAERSKPETAGQLIDRTYALTEFKELDTILRISLAVQDGDPSVAVPVELLHRCLMDAQIRAQWLSGHGRGTTAQADNQKLQDDLNDALAAT